MWALRASFAVLVLAMSTPARAAPGTLVFLTSTAPSVDDHALAEAVIIYTRDLALTLEVRAGAPADITGESLGAVIAMTRSTGARLAFWYRARGEASRRVVVLYAVVNNGAHQTVHALPVAGAPSPALSRLLALKLRAVLTGADEAEPHEPTPEPVLPPVVLPPVALPPAAPSVAPPSPPPIPVVAPASAPAAGARPPPSPYRARAEVAVGYVATLRLDPRLDRHGIALAAAVLLHERWQVHLGIDVSSSPMVTGQAGSATLFDLPIRLGGRVRLRWRRLTFALGPSLSVHILALAGTGNDAVKGSASTAAVGLGGDIVGQVRLTDRLALQLGLRAEDLLPDVHILLHGVQIFDAGGPLFGLVAGAVFSLP